MSMQVTEHNITDWELSVDEINALIALSKDRLKQCEDDRTCEMFYGMIAGKLILMKHDKQN